MAELTLINFLLWLATAGGATVATFFLMEKVPFLAALAAEAKRYASLALSATIPMLAYASAVGLRYVAAPTGWQGWLEALFAIAAPAIVGAQALHGRLVLGRKDAE